MASLYRGSPVREPARPSAKRVSEPGFDRAAFHDDFNRQVVAFFRRTLAPAPPTD